ncbi:hypothetical protein ACOMHN_057800 [Nucella lapillus]
MTSHHNRCCRHLIGLLLLNEELNDQRLVTVEADGHNYCPLSEEPSDQRLATLEVGGQNYCPFSEELSDQRLATLEAGGHNYCPLSEELSDQRLATWSQLLSPLITGPRPVSSSVSRKEF